MIKLKHFLLFLGQGVAILSVAFWATSGICGQEIQVIKIAAQEESAVVRMTDGRLKVIHPGDALPSLGKVTSIDANRISVTNKKNETFIIRLDGEKQVVNRINKVNPTAKSELRTARSVSEQHSSGANYGFRVHKNEKQ